MTAAPVYLDYNASSPLRAEAFEAMKPWLTEKFGNPNSLHRIGQQAKVAIERARATCASVLGCTPEEIVFTSGATESNNIGLRGLVWADRIKRGKPGLLVGGEFEHSAVRETMKDLGKKAFTVQFLPCHADGRMRLDGFKEKLDSAACMTLMYVNNESGVIQPVQELGALCKERGVPVHVDGTQAAGRLSLNVNEIQCTTLALSAHKFDGPQGVGLLYVRKGTALHSPVSGGEQEHGLRGGTQNVAGIVGMAEALKLADAEGVSESSRLLTLKENFENELSARFPKAPIHGKAAPRVTNTTFISFAGVSGESLVSALDLEGVCVSTGAACAEGTNRPSHVLAAMGLPLEVCNSCIRFSSGKKTVAADYERALHALTAISKRLPGMN